MVRFSPKLHVDLIIRCLLYWYEGHPVIVDVRCDSCPVAVRELAKFPPGVITEECTGRPVLLLKLASRLTLQRGTGVETTLGLGTTLCEEVVVAVGVAAVFLEKIYFRLISPLHFYFLPCTLYIDFICQGRTVPATNINMKTIAFSLSILSVVVVHTEIHY